MPQNYGAPCTYLFEQIWTWTENELKPKEEITAVYTQCVFVQYLRLDDVSGPRRTPDAAQAQMRRTRLWLRGSSRPRRVILVHGAHKTLTVLLGKCSANNWAHLTHYASDELLFQCNSRTPGRYGAATLVLVLIDCGTTKEVAAPATLRPQSICTKSSVTTPQRQEALRSSRSIAAVK